MSGTPARVDGGVAPTRRRASLGWVAASPVSAREVYAGVVEESGSVHPASAGCGLGRLLLETSIGAAEAAGTWTVEAKNFPENTASLALPPKLGFEPVGVRRRLGLMTHGPHAGQRPDVLLLERRSDTVGT